MLRKTCYGTYEPLIVVMMYARHVIDIIIIYYIVRDEGWWKPPTRTPRTDIFEIKNLLYRGERGYVNTASTVFLRVEHVGMYMARVLVKSSGDYGDSIGYMRVLSEVAILISKI